MGRVLAGTALTALGTNLWGLNYLLPGIGLVLMLLGFRLLRREEIDACRGHTGGGQRSGVRPGGRLLPKQRLQPAMHNRGRGKAPAGWMIFRHFLWNTAPALPWDSRHTAPPVG